MNEQELQSWNESVEKIDSRIATILSGKGWNQILPNGVEDQDRMIAFYKHIMYVINSFLEEEGTRELFIQLPVEELANKDSKGRDSKQSKRFRWLNGSIAACLQMATIEQFKDNIFVPKEDDYNRTIDRYHVGDYFLAKKRAHGYFYVETIASNRGSRLRFYNSNNGKPQGNPRVAFDECIPDSFVRIERIPLQLRNGVTQIEKAVDIVKIMPKTSRQYQSAALVSIGAYSPINEHLVTDSSLFNLSVRFFSDYQSAISYNPEVIIVCGDSQYSKVAQAYRNTNARKIIYIGSVPPFEANIKCYPFTYREIYRYSSCSHSFTEPTIKELPFPWLNERQRELDGVLNNCIQEDESFTEEDKKIVSRKLLCSFSRYDFDASQLNRIKDIYSEDNIEELFNLNIDVSDNTISKIYNWIQLLEFNGINPKSQWINGQNASLILGKNSAYKRDVKGLCGYNNRIIADNLAVNAYDKRYSYILRYHLFAKITALYYVNESYAIKQLNNYINREYAYYNSDYRKALQTNIDVVLQPTEEILPDWIEKFFEEEYNINQFISSQSERCRVTFDDGTSDIIDGDVIADMGEDGYTDINIRETYTGLEISYYKKPENFEILIAACAKYSERWKQIVYYSALWKCKFIEAYNSFINQGYNRGEAIQTISDNSSLPKERVKAYSKENGNKFLSSKKEMRNMLNYLASLGLITDADKRNVIKAKFYNSEIPLEFGTALKRDLYSTFLGDEPNPTLLDEICANSGISKDVIIASAIVQNKIIKSIKIVSNNE